MEACPIPAQKEVARDSPKKLQGLPALSEKAKRQLQYELNAHFLYASIKGDLTEVRRLLEMGADVNAKNSSGINALMDCALCGHKELAKFLLEKGIERNARDMDGHTALVYSLCGHPEMRDFLLENGVVS